MIMMVHLYEIKLNFSKFSYKLIAVINPFIQIQDPFELAKLFRKLLKFDK